VRINFLGRGEGERGGGQDRTDIKLLVNGKRNFRLGLGHPLESLSQRPGQVLGNRDCEFRSGLRGSGSMDADPGGWDLRSREPSPAYLLMEVKNGVVLGCRGAGRGAGWQV
jgi:hypothetical protein